MATYSFLDVKVSFTGPGAAFSLGASSGVAEEGITVEMVGEKDTLTVGADGTPMHSLHADKSARIIIRLLKTSPANQLLSTAYAFQTTSAANHGQNVLTITDPVRGDFISATYVAFVKQPTLTFGKEAGVNEWMFSAGKIDELLGSGVGN